MPGLPIGRSIAHPSLLADILVSKYADHQPLYRQSTIAARDGVTLDRASMGRWVGQCEAVCAPLTEALRRYMRRPPQSCTRMTRRSRCSHRAAERPAPAGCGSTCATIAARARRNRLRSGSHTRRNRQGIHPQTHLASFKGILQADAYAGFDELFRDGSIREVACHAHARRKFYDIHVRTPSDTTQKALELYWRASMTSRPPFAPGRPPNGCEYGRRKLDPLLQIYEAWLRAKLETLSSKSDTAKAINHSLNQWARTDVVLRRRQRVELRPEPRFIGLKHWPQLFSCRIRRRSAAGLPRMVASML